MCIRMGRGLWRDSGVAGSPVVSGGWRGKGWFFLFFWRCRFGFVLRVILMFGGFFRFVWVLFCYCLATE